MINSAEYDFWKEMLERTMKCARKIPNVTDDYLRKKAYSIKAIMEMEKRELGNFILSNKLTPNAIRKLPKDNSIRNKFEKIVKRIRKLKTNYEYYSDVLYARLFLKGKNSMAAYFILITLPSELKYRMKQIEEEFPSH